MNRARDGGPDTGGIKDRNSISDKIELLRKVSLFSTFEEAELQIVARYSDYCPYSKGETIFREGTEEDELYIIETGEVAILRRSGEETREMARFIAGESFGELDLLDDVPRNATAVAEEDSVLLVFPEKDTPFRSILERHTETSARILNKLLVMIAGRIRSTNRLISERNPWIEDLRRQLFVDKLTDLYNRTYLEEDLTSRLERSTSRAVLLAVKPDDFKRINDTYGHDAGDRVLRLLADTVKACLREQDVGVRYRGDEFVVFLPECDVETGGRQAETLRSAVAELDVSRWTSGARVPLSASIGLSRYPERAQGMSRLVERAFELMLSVRNQGGNGVVIDE